MSYNEGTLTTGEQYEIAMLNKVYEIDKIQEMRMYVYYQRGEFIRNYNIFLQQALEWGWESIAEYVHSLKVKDEKSMTTFEVIMAEELKEIDLVEQEMYLLEQAHKLKEPDDILPFPMDERMKLQWLSRIEHFKKFHTVDVMDTEIIPWELHQETFDDRLRNLEGVDIDEEIRLCKCLIYVCINCEFYHML